MIFAKALFVLTLMKDGRLSCYWLRLVCWCFFLGIDAQFNDVWAKTIYIVLVS